VLTAGGTILCEFIVFKKKFRTNSAVTRQQIVNCLQFKVYFFFCLQMAQPLIAKVLWDNIMENFPEALGDENPNNERIEKLFGDQGGY
jgi:hypothetical protein